ncbi:MAG TPA: radical SAM protein [Bacillota bacterium]|nr:radical SAM protein [Defluviitoga tunisiensis]HPO98647.1 radical SAM protein [Bacillota bacterium]
MKYYQSIPLNTKTNYIGIATRNTKISHKKKYILLSDEVKLSFKKFLAVLTTKTNINYSTIQNVICGLPATWLDSINEGDIISIEPNGTIKVLWEYNSNHNAIMVTNRCNSNCIMCPQPSCDDPADLHINNIKILELICNKNIKNIGLTGGEPTIYLDRCIEIIKKCKKRFPEASISILTNGRLLSINNIEKLFSVKHMNIIFCIPIHADNSLVHDFITNCPGSFSDTINSIQNLALFKQKIELRIVITKLNYQRLRNISEFIYRNFPFCVYVTFMGMEVCGLADFNKNDVWIDPYEYIDKLCEAVKHLHQRNMNVSI